MAFEFIVDTALHKLWSECICEEVSAITAWAVPSGEYLAKFCYPDGRSIP